MAPQLRPHGASHFEARHALKDETPLEVPTRLSIVHRDRHARSPLHVPRQPSYAEHTGSAAHVAVSAEQLILTHEAHAVVPYGRPATVDVRSWRGSSVIPTS